MGWEDRPYYRDRGASAGGLMAILTGSAPLFTAWGIRVRVHASLIALILCELLLDRSPGYDWSSKLASMSLLLGIILLHEFGHCFAAGSVGGWANQILLWPLGGLTFPEIPKRPGARFWTALGGPLVNILICAAAGLGVYLLAGHLRISFNPLASPIPPAQLQWRNPAFYLWWTFVISYLLLVLNLLPIYPLDGGRILQTILWKFVGHQRSMLYSCMFGMGASISMAIFAVAMWNGLSLTILLLAACLFFACYQEKIIQRESGSGESWQGDEAEFSSNGYEPPDPAARRRRRLSKRAQRIARKHALDEIADRQRLDAILVKVSARGLSSLTWRERRTLRLATERRRQQDTELKDILEK